MHGLMSEKDDVINLDHSLYLHFYQNIFVLYYGPFTQSVSVGDSANANARMDAKSIEDPVVALQLMLTLCVNSLN